MFERFTPNARQVVVQAQSEAREFQHAYIGTEHVLLGLFGVPTAPAAVVLRRLGLTKEAARDELDTIIGRGQSAPPGHIAFTPRAKKVLELALREALQLKHNYIGTEHILLALIREGEGVAAQIMVRRLHNLNAVRKAMLAELEGMTPEDVSGTTAVRRHKTTGAADEAFSAAEALAGGAPMGSHHLLEALIRSEGSMAAQVLSSLGVDPEALAAKIDELDPESTTDATPEETAARQMELRLEDGEVHLIFKDEDTVDLASKVTELTGGPIHGTGPVAGIFVPLWTSTNQVLLNILRTLQPEPEGEPKDIFGKASLMMRRVLRSRLQSRRRPPGQAGEETG